MNDEAIEVTSARIFRQIEELNEALGDQIIERLQGNRDEAQTLRTNAEIERLQSKLRALSERKEP